MSVQDVATVGVLGLLTTSSVIIGAAVGLYLPIPRKLLAGILAFASGSLIAALAIELGFEGAHEMVKHGKSVHQAWFSVAGGFAIGAVVYYVASLFLEQKGAAIRYPSRFLEYALNRKRAEADQKIALLSRSELLRHLSAEDIEPLVERLQERRVAAGETVFRAGDAGDRVVHAHHGIGSGPVVDRHEHGDRRLVRR